jgi:hypothetical protein
MLLHVGSSVSFVDELGETLLAPTDLSDNADIAYLDGENEFTSVPTYKDPGGDVHHFLITPVDSTSGQSSLHATETTVINGVSTHITKPLTVPSEHFEKNAGGISIHRLPFSSTEAHNSFKKASPYRAITGNEKGALIGRLITDEIFHSWVMGELSDTGADKRDNSDKYKHGLVPQGAVYVNGEAQEFLRKDGN